MRVFSRRRRSRNRALTTRPIVRSVNYYAKIEAGKLPGVVLKGGADNFIKVIDSSKPLGTTSLKGSGGKAVAETPCFDAMNGFTGPAVRCEIIFYKDAQGSELRPTVGTRSSTSSRA